MKKFVLIGVGGYISPRHLKAIKDTGNILVAALDKHDSVGIIDSYFPECSFFTEFERFDRHINKMFYKKEPVDYLSICSPNYLHDSHIRYGLRNNMEIICEKPLIINYDNFEFLKKLEKKSKKKVNVVLQLRLHPEMIKLKQKIENSDKNNYQINLEYFTPRGKWYDYSWKADISKSGGVLMNIGVHLFDLLLWLFGDVKNWAIYRKSLYGAEGNLSLEKADVRWKLSIKREDCKFNNYKPHRLLEIDNNKIDINNNFTDLHTEVYEQILQNNGYGIEDTENSIKLINEMSKCL